MLTFTESDLLYDKKKIEEKICEYIPLIEKEYGFYMQNSTKNYLEENKNQLVEFNKEQTISFFVTRGKLLLPTVTYEIFPILMEESNYNSNPNNRVDEADYLNTDTTYDDYINHVVEAGLTPYDYFEESLLHEVMHLCGSGGGTPLEEGINELKTRELALKYRIKIAAMGYSKEVEIAKQLQNIIGKETMSEVSFLSPTMATNLIGRVTSKEIAELYKNVRNTMIAEGNDYNKRMHKISNPVEKARVYQKVNYSKSHQLIDEYKLKQNNIKK